MQVQDDPGARGAGGGERSPAQGRIDVVRVDDASAGAADGVVDLLRVEAAAQQALGGLAL